MSQDPKSRPVDLLPAAGAPRRGPPPLGRQRDDDPGLRDLAWCVVRERRLVLAAIATALSIGAAYQALAEPVYRSDVLLQVEETRTGPRQDDLSFLSAEEPPAAVEVELLRSRSLLGAVVEELGLDVEARPRTFPLVGRAFVRRHRGPWLAAPLLGLSRYAWGGERIRVSRLTVSDDLVDVPLLLTATGPDRFRLDARGVYLASGRVGEPVAFASREARVEALVSELGARPGTVFTLVKRRASDVVASLDARLHVTEKGRQTGLVLLDMEGADPVRVASVLDSLARAYVRQNAERSSADAARALASIDSELPEAKRRVDAAEAALSSARLRRGTVDLSHETQAIFDRSAGIERELSELELRGVELRQRFTGSHPALEELDKKVEKLRAQRSAVAARMASLPETEREAARLARDAKVASDLYALLLRRAEELRVKKSVRIGNARVVDRAVLPSAPMSPKPLQVLALSALLGLGAGVAAAIARRSFGEGTEDADEIERATGIPVYAAVPHSPTQEEIGGEGQHGSRRGSAVLSAVAPGDAAVESLRRLRTSLELPLAEAHGNVVVIGGPAPAVGRSFVALNLAHVSASADRRVLVVDADLRGGRLHDTFGVEREPGLSEVVNGDAPLAAALRRTEHRGLDFLPTGRMPPNPAEILASRRFHDLLAELGSRYDLVVVDTPPILAVADAALVGRGSAVYVLVLRARKHPVREIALAVKELHQCGVGVHCAVLNDVSAMNGRYGRYGRYRWYECASLDHKWRDPPFRG